VSVEIRVEENPAEFVSGMLVEAAKAGGQIVLTGGSTPKLAYEMAARADADWSDATVWFSDERCVPPESGISNYRMANEALLGRLMKGVRPTVMRMEGELGPDAGSASYEALVPSTSALSRAGTCCCWGWGPIRTARRCSPASRRCRSAGGWSPASNWPGWSRRCRGSR